MNGATKCMGALACSNEFFVLEWASPSAKVRDLKLR